MKITKIETLEIDLSGQNGLDLWRPIYVRIHTDEGISGMGSEPCLWYGIRGYCSDDSYTC